MVSISCWVFSLAGFVPLPLTFWGCDSNRIVPVGIRAVRWLDIQDNELEALLQHRSALFVEVVGECESRGYLLAASVVRMVTVTPVASVAPVASVIPVAPVVVAMTPAVPSVVTASLVVISETLEDFPQLSAGFSVSFCTGRSQLHDMPSNLFTLTIAVAVHSVAD